VALCYTNLTIIIIYYTVGSNDTKGSKQRKLKIANCEQNYELSARYVWNRFFFISVPFQFVFLKTQILFGMSLVRVKKMQFVLNIIVIYYSLNRCVVDLQQILQRQWMTGL